ncbi:MAG: hypothetical protein H5U40_00870, partial [Polyangiaceae bacterium]|nr:hypothetical protein [Polyangiaceae bacterium]
MPDAMILRGHLLIQAERYDEADALFERLRGRFEPLRLELEKVPSEHPDLRAHFRPLVRERLQELSVETFLPESVRAWTKTHRDFGRALGILAELSEAKRNVAYIEDLILRLRAALEAPNPITVLRDLRTERQRIEVLANCLVSVRARVADAEAARDPAGGGTLGNLRAARRDLERELESLPRDSGAFERRDAEIVREYRSLASQLPELHRAVVSIEARIGGAEHALRSASDGGVIGETPELAEMRQAVEDFRLAIREVERGLESGRLRIGVGDERSLAELSERERLARMIAEERRLSGAAGRGDGEQAIGRVAAL